MTFKKLSLEGLIEITPRVFHDVRGFFFESYSEITFRDNVLDLHFVQDNHSFSHKGVIRGLHFQKPPYQQGKLIRVISGRVLDVAVDIRPESDTFGEHITLELSSQKANMLWIPPGFAHGFVALEDSIFVYKCTGLYEKQAEDGIIWNDPDLDIDWQVTNMVVSDKDKEFRLFKDNQEAFKGFKL